MENRTKKVRTLEKVRWGAVAGCSQTMLLQT